MYLNIRKSTLILTKCLKNIINISFISTAILDTPNHVNGDLIYYYFFSTALLDAPNTVNGDLIYYKCDHPDDRLTPDSCGKQFILNSKKVYQKCGLSNPRTSPELCGRTQASTLCDPDGILTKQQG